jgi:hypothetical protein
MGIKLFAFSRRRQGVTLEEFQQYWEGVHARQIADEPSLRRHVRRYELNHRLPEDYDRDRFRPEGAGAGWDGAAVLWFDSPADFEAMQAEPAFGAHAGDGAEFRDEAQRVVLTHDPEVIVTQPHRGDAEAKMVCILRRNPELDLATFHEHWLQHHGGLFQRIPELNEPLLGYEQNHGLDVPGAPFDGVTEQWFRSYGSFLASLAVEAVEREVNPDLIYFLDPSSIEFIMASPPAVVVGDV